MRVPITCDRHRHRHRHWRCDELAEPIVNPLLARSGADLIVVHGGMPCVDNAFAVACRTLAVVAEPHLANWIGLCNIAEPTRNREMVEAGADQRIVLHRRLEASQGIKDRVGQALTAGIPVYLIEDERAVPTRIEAADKRLE
jgi:hypothetical protein